LTCSFQLEHRIERSLMLKNALLAGKPEALANEAHVKACGLCDLSCCRMRGRHAGEDTSGSQEVVVCHALPIADSAVMPVARAAPAL
jgi:hypothetical protein